MRHFITDNLLLRTVESETDIRKLIDLCNSVFSDTEQPDPRIGEWVSALLTPGNHPTLTQDNYFLVEDTTGSEIVSTLNVIPQTWTYDGIPFGVGRIELVGTRKEYRRQGLVREQFKAAHQRCADLGLPVQGITGIYWYYRQFGYEYALDLGGRCHIALNMIPETPASSPFNLREWQPADLPRLEALYAFSIRKALVACQRPTEHWHYRFAGQSPQSIQKQWLYAITQAGKIVGYVIIPLDCWGSSLRIAELVTDVPYPDLIPWLLPRLRDEIPARFPDADPPLKGIDFHLGRRYPVYPYLKCYQPVLHAPYAWYIRVPDPAAFIHQIAPALEKRIAHSPLAGLTRSLTLDFYTSGLRLDFEEGRLAAAANLPRGIEKSDGRFPPLVFLQLLFGYRSLSQIFHSFPDAGASLEVCTILNTLFPRKPSWVVELY
ncbi:MAG: GNAT family N-acetyltransferase [Anaerolineae bacterium]|nr:GNAT family N-acetyltransferase [Anaerolineae bacterium]